MTRSSSQPAAPAGFSLAEVFAAKTATALKKVAAQIPEFEMPPGDLAAQRVAVIAAAMEQRVLRETVALEVVQNSPELNQAMEDRLAETKAAIAAVAEAAAAAAATAAAAVTQVTALQQQVASLEQKVLEAADVPEQQQVATHVVIFAMKDLADAEQHRGDSTALGAGACKALATVLKAAKLTSQNMPNAFLLNKPTKGPAPLVIVLDSLSSKVALLRAARAARDSGVELAVSARLTRWQQQRKAALRPQLEQLKVEGATVRMWAGHRLQRKDGASWADVPASLPASQPASQPARPPTSRQPASQAAK